MTTTSPTAAAAPPVAAASPAPPAAAGGSAQLVPGGSFVPAGQGTPAPSTAPTQDAAAGQAAAGQPAETPGIDAAKGLALLKQEFGDSYSDPIVAADGNVYMETRKPALVDGKLVLQFALAGRIDKSTGKLLVNPEFLKSQPVRRDPNAKLVKVEDKYFWQTPVKGEDGSITAKMEPVSDAELQAMGQQQQAQEAQQAQQAWNQDKVEWMRKLGSISSLMKITGYSGSLIDSLRQGPNPYTGKTGANWMTGWMVLQMIDGQAEGKLLPQWMKKGPVSVGLEWGLQSLFWLDMGRDLTTLAQKFPRLAAAGRAFTAPTRAVWEGIRGLGAGLAKATAPAAAATQAISGAAAAGQRIGLAGEAMQAAQAAGQAAAGAAGTSGAVTAALKQLGGEFQRGTSAIVGAPGTVLADKVAIMTNVNGQNALQMVSKESVYAATKLTSPPLTGGMKVQAAVTNGIHGAMSALKPFLRTLQVGGSIFGTIAGALNIAVTVKNQGAKSLITTKDGRGALFGFLGSGAFLGLMSLQALAPMLGPHVGVVAAGLSVASNIFSGISMLNYAGFFGEGGWLDKDVARAAFLIPPLTPLGLAALWFKKREKEAKAKAALMEQNQKSAVEKITQLRSTTAQQIQSSGKVAGANQTKDGSIAVATGVSNDLSQAPQPSAASPVGENDSRTLQLISRPMR